MDRELLLYVEDDDDNWEVAQLRLAANYVLVRARDAEEACSLIRERGGEIAMILMDIELRGSDLTGVELTRVLRGEPVEAPLPSYARNIRPVTKPIVFLTAHSAKHTKIQLLLAGAEQVISKPVDFDELQRAIVMLAGARPGPGG
jgi:CheY-like chemotaxis protein